MALAARPRWTVWVIRHVSGSLTGIARFKAPVTETRMLREIQTGLLVRAIAGACDTAAFWKWCRWPRYPLPDVIFARWPAAGSSVTCTIIRPLELVAAR